MSMGARDTVVIDESVHNIYRQLTEGNDLMTAPFRTMKDVFLWAACIGSRMGNGKPILGKKLTIFRWAQFSTQIDLPIIKAIVLSDSQGEIEIIQDQDRTLQVIENFANAGISELGNAAVSGSHCIFKLIEMMK